MRACVRAWVSRQVTGPPCGDTCSSREAEDPIQGTRVGTCTSPFPTLQENLDLSGTPWCPRMHALCPSLPSLDLALDSCLLQLAPLLPSSEPRCHHLQYVRVAGSFLLGNFCLHFSSIRNVLFFSRPLRSLLRASACVSLFLEAFPEPCGLPRSPLQSPPVAPSVCLRSPSLSHDEMHARTWQRLLPLRVGRYLSNM